MLRIRIHGRGGQGVKTASQVLGSAGFLSGYQAQDFPLYGAERRGAPIVAYTRLSPGPILERGAIARPDLILVGDETLLQDPLAAPLGGADESTVLFINSTHGAEDLKAHFNLPALPVAFDLADICARHIKRGTVLSSPLAAVGARMSGIVELDTLLTAVRMELSDLGVGEEMIARNLDLAREVYAKTPPAVFKLKKREPLSASTMANLKQEDVVNAAPLILAPANMALRKTGNWRVQRPEIDLDVCNGCWICFIRCPDGVIHMDGNDKPAIDYDHCKGCLICAEECPSDAIKVLREVTSWA